MKLPSVLFGDLVVRQVPECMEGLFGKWRITVRFGASVERVAARGADLEVELSTGQVLFPDTLLFAAGRVANTQTLGLEALGVDSDL